MGIGWGLPTWVMRSVAVNLGVLEMEEETGLDSPSQLCCESGGWKEGAMQSLLVSRKDKGFLNTE